MIEIDLGQLTKNKAVKNLSGKDRGIAARKYLDLDEKDKLAEPILIQVPEFVDVITPSYFQGLFSQSVKALGGREGFSEHYVFNASSEVMKWINRGIDRCVMKRTALD